MRSPVRLSMLSSRSAFTLIELLVVILVIAILIAVAAPSFLGQTQKAEDSAAKQSLAIAYKAAKAGTITEQNQGSWVSAAAVVQSINDSEPGLSAAPGSNAPSASKDGQGRTLVNVEVSGATLTLHVRTGDDRHCYVAAQANGSLGSYTCQSASAGGPAAGVILSGLALLPVGYAYSPDDSNIVYSSHDGEASDVFSVPSAGGTPTVIADGTMSVEEFSLGNPSFFLPGDRVLVAWSPLTGPTNYHLFSVPVTGGAHTDLTPERDYSVGSASPDGSQIAYMGYPLTCTVDSVDRGALFVMNADGTGKTQLTDECDLDVVGQWPRWSTDGDYLLFRTTSAVWQLISTAGGPPQALPALAEEPAFSPDSSQIAFKAGGALYVSPVSSPATAQLVVPAAYDVADYVWTSNSSLIHDGTTDSNLWESGDLFSVSTTGGGPTNLTNNPTGTYVGKLTISPNRQRVTYTLEVGSSKELHIGDAADLGNDISVGVIPGGDLAWSNDSSLLLHLTQSGSTYGLVAVNAD